MPMMNRVLGTGTVLCLLAGCASDGNRIPDYIPPPQAKEVQDVTYCQAIEINARRYSRRAAIGGWMLGVLSVASIGAGTVLAATAESPGRKEKAFTLSLPILGALLGYGATAEFKREEQHGALAAAAALALNEQESTRLCNEALAKWNIGRADANAALSLAMQAVLKAGAAEEKARAAEEKAGAAEEKAGAAEQKAGAAKK